MYCVHVEFRIKPDRLDDFMVRMRQQRDDSLQHEPGCHTFDVWVGGAEANAVMLYEIYESPTAFQAHLDSDHFASFDAAVAEMIDLKTVRIWEQQE